MSCEDMCNINPTIDKFKLGITYNNLKYTGATIKKIEINGGNAEFYGMYGSEILRKTIDTVMENLEASPRSSGFFCGYIVNRMGLIYAISKSEISVRRVTVKDSEGNPLEVGLSISGVDISNLEVE